MAKSLAKVDASNVWRGHLKIKGQSPVPSDLEYDIWRSCDTGVSIQDAAEEFGLSERKIRESISKTEKFFISTCTVDVGLLKIRQHARLEAIIQTAMEDYQNSGGVVTTTSRKRAPRIEGEDDAVIVMEETINEKELTRDPRFLNMAMKAMEEQRKLWPGANAPSASTITNADGTGELKINVAQVVANMTADEIKALRRVEEICEQQDVIDV